MQGDGQLPLTSTKVRLRTSRDQNAAIIITPRLDNSASRSDNDHSTPYYFTLLSAQFHDTKQHVCGTMIQTTYKVVQKDYAKPPCRKISSLVPIDASTFRFENSPLKSRRSSKRSTCRRTSPSPSNRLSFSRVVVCCAKSDALIVVLSTDLDASPRPANVC